MHHQDHTPEHFPESGPTDLAFLFIGGEHQILHLAPVAAEISNRRPDLMVRCVCADARTATALLAVASTMHAEKMLVTQLPLPWAARAAVRMTRRREAAKGPLLASIRWHVRDARAVIVPERTSAMLRKLGWRRPIIHFRHGAGDRAPASETRLKAFDAIMVAGSKDIERAVLQGIDRERLHAAGYIKLDYLRNAVASRDRIFDNDRQTILYNPHFDRNISSIGIARDVIDRFRQQDRYNLIYAPHIRAVKNLSAAARIEWEALAVPGRILIDLGSSGLFDMRYVRTADFYLGDMSSQLYEFLERPRPVAFLNVHGADWQQDPRYAGWRLGEVATGPQDMFAAINRAFERQPEQVTRQIEAVAFAFGEYRGSIGRAADILLEILGSTEKAGAGSGLGVLAVAGAPHDDIRGRARAETN